MTDNIHTVTLTPQEQAAFESGRKIGWNEGIEASAKLVDEAWNFRIASRLPDAIRALSMPAPAQAWRVKPLEWTQTKDGGWWASDCYRIRVLSEYYVVSGWISGTNPYDTLEEAKAAAQADYAARILAALIPASKEGGA